MLQLKVFLFLYYFALYEYPKKQYFFQYYRPSNLIVKDLTEIQTDNLLHNKKLKLTW